MKSLGKKILVYGLISMLASPFGVMPRLANAAGTTPADEDITVFYAGQGKIYPMTESLSEVQANIAPKQIQAVVVDTKQGTIHKVIGMDDNTVSDYVGNSKYKQVELGEGQVMFPGFVDPHSHFPNAVHYTSIDLRPSPIHDIDTLAQLQKRLAEKVTERNYAGDGINYISAEGYDDTMLDIGRHPYHEELSVTVDGVNLGQYYVHLTHISKHMVTVNTKYLELLFDIDYINKIDFKGAVGLAVPTQKDPNIVPDTVTKAELIQAGETVVYQLTYTKGADGSTGNTIRPGGIVMKPTAVDTLKKISTYGSEKECYLACMTGVFQETVAMGYLVAPSDKVPYSFDRHERVRISSNSYAKKGATTSVQGGHMPYMTLPEHQEALLKGGLKIRTIINPFTYNYFADFLDGSGAMNHYALGWENVTPGQKASDNWKIGNPNKDLSPEIGGDLTDWYCKLYYDRNTGAYGIKANKGENVEDDPYSFFVESQQMYTAGQPSKSPAYQLYELKKSEPAKYNDRIILGAWKILYDGSNQGYTGFFGQEGYYKLNEGETTFPLGRTGAEKDGNVIIDRLGMESYPDDKNFIKKGNHYGNAGCFSVEGNDPYAATNKAFTLYHNQGQTLHMHLNGSRANADGVTFIENAVKADIADGGLTHTDTRHTIIHGQMQELVDLQRLMGNVDDYPLKNPADIKKLTTVFQGAAELNWVADNPQNDSTTYKNNDNNTGYDPEEGSYELKFSSEAQNRRSSEFSDAMKKQNAITSYYVDHTYYWGDRHRDIFMGPGSALNMSPLGWAVSLGHRWTMHNDTDVVPFDPLMSVTAATTRMSSGYDRGGKVGTPQPIYHEGAPNYKSGDLTQTVQYLPTDRATEKRDYVFFDQRISVLQAMHGLTVNSAMENKLEGKIGSIQPNLYADFVILNQDPFELEKQGAQSDIKNIDVQATIVAGEKVWGIMPGAQEGDYVDEVSASTIENDNITGTVSDLKEQTIAEDTQQSFVNNDTVGEVFLGAEQVTATVTPAGATSALRMTIIGNGDKANTITLLMYDENSGTYETFTQVFNKDDLDDGKFVITDMNQVALGEDGVLKTGQSYDIHFAIKDDGTFDTDRTPGTIETLAVLGADSLPSVATSAPAGGGSSGGCTVGTTAQFDLAVVFFAALGLLAVRVYRRREDA